MRQTLTLPLFPLGTVLFPGVVLPMHISEERQRHLVRDLMDGPEPRQFGVIAIQRGRETCPDADTTLYEVGCTTTLRRIEEHADGRLDLDTVGGQRFRLLAVTGSQPYLQGEVELLTEGGVSGDDMTMRLVAAVQRTFNGYLHALTARAGLRIGVPDLPAEPVELSYLIASSMIIDLPDKQRLLAEPDAARRLAAERVMLARETRMLRSLTAAPATHLRYTPYSLN